MFSFNKTNQTPLDWFLNMTFNTAIYVLLTTLVADSWHLPVSLKVPAHTGSNKKSFSGLVLKNKGIEKTAKGTNFVILISRIVLF